MNSLNVMGSMMTTSVLISGKKRNMDATQMADYLKSLPSERVERIEIIYDAPPELHIQGAAINVIHLSLILATTGVHFVYR
jgi:hypothetical protein